LVTKKAQAVPTIIANDDEQNEHSVFMTAGTVELPKQPAALSLDVHDSAGKLGTLKVSRGSLRWKVGNQTELTLSWPRVAALFKSVREQKAVAATKKRKKSKQAPRAKDSRAKTASPKAKG
jgi:hypothetical protein